MLTLAQGLETVDDLPAGPLWQRMLLEEPVGTMLGIALLAVLIGVALNRAGKAKLLPLVVIGGTGLALAVYLVGQSVETPREAIEDRVRTFVDAVAAGDAQTLDELIEPEVVIASSGSAEQRVDKEWLIAVAERAPTRVESHSLRLRGVEMTARNAGRARLNISVRTDQGSFPSTWDLYWREGDSGAWTLTRVDALVIMGQRPERLGWIGRTGVSR